MSKHKIPYLPVAKVRHWNELAALKAERTELREALAELMDNRGSMAALERAQEILKRTRAVLAKGKA